MIFFITVLRALACCLITNSHYSGIYPIDIIASGGLIGDILFFAVSGYCLYNVKGNFFKWYGKRVYRCYLPVIIITALYAILGFYRINTYSLTGDFSLSWYFIYPTNYHFVSSIVITYIPYYFIMKTDFLKKRLPIIMAVVAVAALTNYLFLFDKSFYHIDNVRLPFVKFLFMESMLLGAYFKQNDQKYRNKFSKWVPFATVFALVLYFASKIIFSKKPQLSELQIINQVAIFVLLYLIFRLFASLDKPLSNMPQPIKKAITFVSNITLEIYVVQSVLISLVEKTAPFPINWLLATCSIIISAVLLHYVCGGIIFVVDLIISKTKSIVTKENQQ